MRFGTESRKLRPSALLCESSKFEANDDESKCPNVYILCAVCHCIKYQVGVIAKHRGKVTIVKLLGDLLLTVGEDAMLYLWNLRYVLK